METERLILEPCKGLEETYRIILAGSGAAVGQIGFDNIETGYLDADNEAELTGEINEPFRRCHYASEAIREMLRHGFDEMHLEVIRAHCQYGDPPARGCLEKAGFVPEHPARTSDDTEFRGILIKLLWQQNERRRLTHMNYTVSRYRIFRRENDGRISAEIEFPEISHGQYRIVRLFAAPEWDGTGVREDLMNLAVQQIQQRGGRVTASDPWAERWLQRRSA